MPVLGEISDGHYYDTLKERYLWLVTSILKDERLTVETF